MKNIVMGILAHVDAGKTTLSEALLYRGGTHRKLGRVDDGSAFLDSSSIEKQRGITVFSHQASVQYDDLKLTLLDTPGHVDFTAQTEQVLPVLDYAILVVSATAGIQGSTRTLWRLLDKYQIPTFIFINKTDVISANVERVVNQLQTEFDEGCLPFQSHLTDDDLQDIATTDESALDQYLNNGQISSETIKSLIKNRHVFPIYQGSALKLTGIDELIGGLSQWTSEPTTDQETFTGRVFKISHDDNNERLTWLRVLSGTLTAKSELLNNEKVNQIRVYNGNQFAVKQSVNEGEICAVTGLQSSFPGQGLGTAEDLLLNDTQPVLNYAVDLKGNDPHQCLKALQNLEDEDPHLNIQWSEDLQEIHLQIMGEIQLEIIQELLKQRYNLQVGFSDGQILYKETISDNVEGVGHFEPLRHYAEVHLLLTPAPRGSGVRFHNKCSVDVLPHNWQEQIMTSLKAKQHRGVLIGAPLTDVDITLISGRGSIVHSVGGDFRKATWRAVRQGLMMLLQQDSCKLLEPWYRYRLTIDQEHVGRVINDIQQMAGTFQIDDHSSNTVTIIYGTAPVASMRNYQQTVRSYTHGEGELELSFNGYQGCHNTAEIISKTHYEPTADLENTPDSVFCAHGAGYPVKWDQVPQKAHVPLRE